MNMLKVIKIPTKIFGGFAIILALLLVISATGAVNLYSGNASFQEYRGTARATNLAGQVDVNLLATRFAVLKYLNLPSEALAKNAKEAIEGTIAVTGDLNAQITQSELRKPIEAATAYLAEYQGAFNEVTALQAQVDALSVSLTKAGETITANLDTIIKTSRAGGEADATYWGNMLMRDFLMMRLFAMKAVFQHDTTADEKVKAGAQAMRDHHANMVRALQNPAQRDLARDVATAIELYDTTFLKTRALARESGKIADDSLYALGPKIAAAMGEIKTATTRTQEILGPRASAAMDAAIYMTVTVAFVSIVVGILAAWLIGGSISKPIGAITAAMKTLAAGDKTVAIPGQDHKDEIGSMAAAVQVFKDNMIKADELAAREAEQARLRNERAQRIEELTSSFDAEISELLNTVASASTEMESTATSMAGIASNTNERATTVASAAEQASSNVQMVAAATDELNSSVQEISRQVNTSAEIASRASTQAAKTDGQVRGLANAAQRIGEVVSLISAIAEQTNLLALNATIEAARAGDAGRGFAVVAAEVKELATQTGKATEEISQQVNGIQAETAEAVKAIQSIGAIINEVNEIASSIASAVEEQSAATGEIARNVEQAATGTQQVTANIIEVTQSANETGAAATQVTGVAGDLNRKAEQLKVQVEMFLEGVRAA